MLLFRRVHVLLLNGFTELLPIDPDGKEQYLYFVPRKDVATVTDILFGRVEAAPILELIIRQQTQISLEGAKSTSPIRRYLKVKEKNEDKKDDLELCSTQKLI